MPPSRFFYRDAAAPEPTQPLSLGVVAFIEREGAILLERRVDSGRWGLVGGAVELNDSLEAALRREVQEETGLTVSRFSLFGTSPTLPAASGTRRATWCASSRLPTSWRWGTLAP